MPKPIRTKLVVAAAALTMSGGLLGLSLAQYAQAGAFSFYKFRATEWHPGPTKTMPPPDTTGFYPIQPYANAETSRQIAVIPAPANWVDIDYPQDNYRADPAFEREYPDIEAMPDRPERRARETVPTQSEPVPSRANETAMSESDVQAVQPNQSGDGAESATPDSDEPSQLMAIAAEEN